MNQSYQLHENTASRLHDAATVFAELMETQGNSDRAGELRAAAGTLAAQNPDIPVSTDE